MRSSRRRQRDVLQRLHQVAEHGALRAARGLHLLLELLLVIGLALGAHHDDRKLLVVVDAGDHVVGQQHVLVEQVAEREIFRIVADRHRGHDLLRIEEDRERALDRHRGLDRRAGLVDAGDALGQPRIERIGPDEVVVLEVRSCHCNISARLRLRKRSSAVIAVGDMVPASPRQKCGAAGCRVGEHLDRRAVERLRAARG